MGWSSMTGGRSRTFMLSVVKHLDLAVQLPCSRASGNGICVISRSCESEWEVDKLNSYHRCVYISINKAGWNEGHRGLRSSRKLPSISCTGVILKRAVTTPEKAKYFSSVIWGEIQRSASLSEVLCGTHLPGKVWFFVFVFVFFLKENCCLEVLAGSFFSLPPNHSF